MNCEPGRIAKETPGDGAVVGFPTDICDGAS